VTIRDLIRDYVLADATVASLIGTRLFPDQLPANKAIWGPIGAVIVAVDIVRPNTFRAAATLATARIQIDVYAAAYTGQTQGPRANADAVGAAIRQRLDGQALTLTDDSVSPAVEVKAWVRFDLETENAEPDLHGGLSRHTADYLIHFQTSEGAY
jgi:hypothetical protein